MMFISPRVLEAGEILARAGEVRSLPLIILPAFSPQVKYLKSEQAIRTLVAMEIRTFLERKDIQLILAVFGFFGASRSYVIGGSETENHDGMRTDYGFNSEGPFKETFKSRQFRPKHEPLCTERISPEELLEHINYPEMFLKSIHHHLDAAAQAILEREQKKEVLNPKKSHRESEK